MIKIELTKEELQTLLERVEQAINDEIGVGDMIELEKIVEIEIVCSDCHGTGEVTVDEAVYPDAGSPTAPIGTRTCHCKHREEEHDEE